MAEVQDTLDARTFIDEGQGDPVVLIHSSGSTRNQWRKLVALLAPHYRVIAPDLCGYGLTADQAGQFTFEDDCRRMRRFIELPGRKVHLAGHSYGGVVASRLAIDNPEHIASLILFEPSCFHLLREAGKQVAFDEISAIREAQIASARRGDLAASAKGFVDYWMGPEAWPAMDEERQTLIAKTAPKVVGEWPGAFGPRTRLSDYAAFPWRTLLMRAADTTLVARTVSDLMREQLRDCEFVEIAHGGHMAPVTNPDPVNAAIKAFLDTHRDT